MLVKFAIDPQALLKEANPYLIYFDRLIEKWENFGILVNVSEIDDKIDSIDADIREELEVILKDSETPLRFRFLEDNVPHVNWETLDDDNIGRLRGFSDSFELAVLNDELAYVIGALERPLSFDQQREMCGGVEPIGLAIADRARAWRRASSISRRGFSIGDDHEMLWNERFSRLVEFSSQIVIVDAYALHDSQLNGFIKLLQLIDRDAKSCRVTLYSSPDRGRSVVDPDEAVRQVRETLTEEVDRLSLGGVQQVTVRLLPLGEQEHDRRIRFDRSVYAPENSIALVFSGDGGTVPQSVGCQLRLSDEEYHPFDVMKRTENELLRRASNVEWLTETEDYIILHPRSSAS